MNVAVELNRLEIATRNLRTEPAETIAVMRVARATGVGISSARAQANLVCDAGQSVFARLRAVAEGLADASTTKAPAT
jgi:hypothetical protein